MSAQLALPMPPAREAGMQAAYDHASDEFKVAGYTFLCDFAKRATGLFITEDVSDAYAATQLPQPREKRAWAGLWRKAVNDRVVAIVDSEGRSRIRHSPTYRYRSLVAA